MASALELVLQVSSQVLVQRRQRHQLAALAGVDVAGDLPGYEALIRACAASATNTPAPSPTAGTVFAPVTDNLQSLGLRLFEMALSNIDRGASKAVPQLEAMATWEPAFISKSLSAQK